MVASRLCYRADEVVAHMVVVRGLDLLAVIGVDEVVDGCKLIAVVPEILAEDIVVERTAAVVVVSTLR